MKAKRLFIITLVFLIFSVQPISAHELLTTETPTPTPVEYSLPYPGILPGHPFYFFKTIRDKVSGFFISNPLKKAEFNLLQTDKGFASAQTLLDQKQDKVKILSVLDEALTYFKDALTKIEEANKQGMETKALTQKLAMANRKHQEMLSSMVQITREKDKQLFISRLEKVKAFGKQVKKLDR